MYSEIDSLLAAESIRNAAKLLKQAPQKTESTQKESLRDIVTEYDLIIEEYLIDFLKGSNHPIVGEETSADKLIEDKTSFWAIDPIDGTVNFSHGLEYYALSVGLCSIQYDQTVNWETGAVTIPSLNQIYTIKERQSYEGGNLLKMKNVSLDSSLIAACFSSTEKNPSMRNLHYSIFGQLNDMSRGVVRLGSAAVQICYTAQGKIQATYGLGCKIWDVAGAMAIAKYAGCKIWTKRIPGTNRLNFIVGGEDVTSSIKELLETQGLFLF